MIAQWTSNQLAVHIARLHQCPSSWW